MNSRSLLAADEAEANSDHRSYALFGYVAIGIVFGAFGLWAALAPLDRAAVAQGQVSIETSHKLVQHLEGGIIKEILVKETEQVKEGQVLFRLQPTQALANADLFRKQIDISLALEARLISERTNAAMISFPDSVLARQNVAETAAAIADQRRLLTQRRDAMASQINILTSQVEQKRQEIAGRVQQRTTLNSQLTSYLTEINSVSSLVAKGYYPRNKLLGLERERDRIQGEASLNDSEIARLTKVLDEAQLQIGQARQKYDQDVSQQLADVRAKLSDMREKLVIAEDVLTRVEVKAERAGVLQGLKVHTIGAVVKPGDTLAEIIPVGDKLEVSARVLPLDIETVDIGQKAEVRLPNFSSRRTPVILGKVASVSADAMTDETTHQAYYQARILIDPATVPPEVASRLVPGMQADVLISTGERTLLAYLVDPLLNSFSKTMHEK